MVRIGIAGLGTVGAGLVKLLRGAEPLRDEGIVIAGVSARARGRDRGVDLSGYVWFDDPVALAAAPDVDVLVELIGGAEGPARRAVETALARGAHVVTANKALLAVHGAALARLSEEKGGQVRFEAAVGGGVPMVKAVREGLAGARIQAVSGILNGTCNYLLTEMEASGRAYADVLADAQRLGYAEADPTMDVSGADAAHKIAILAGVAFGFAPALQDVAVEGVEGVALLDIRLVAKLGYRLKLLAKAERAGAGVRVHVHPALLPYQHPLAAVGGALNALVVDAEETGRLTFIGAGAGQGPTAAAVAADLVDLAHGARRPVFGRPLSAMRALAKAPPAEQGRYYLRLLVEDRPGVIAAVTDRLGKAGVSIESFLQDARHDTPDVPIVLTTQTTPRAALDAAVEEIASLHAVLRGPPRVIAIEDGH